MEHVLPQKIHDYIYEKLIKVQFDKFITINKTNLSKKSYDPVLINSQNTYLSRTLIEKIFQFLFPNEKNIIVIYEHKLNCNKTTFNVKISKNHIEISPSEYGINDKSIVGEYLFEVSSNQNIITGNKKNIIVWNIDKIGGIAFESLHNIIKNNEDTANFICVSQSLNKIDSAIFSSLTLLNIENPDKKFYADFLEYFNEDFKVSEDITIFLKNIKLGCSEYNFNSFLKNIAIFYNFKLTSLDNLENSFRKFIESLYLKITNKNKISDTFIEEIRNLLYDLYVYHFSYQDIVTLFMDLVSNDKNISDEKKMKILEYACFFNTTSSKGNKEVIHLEGFIYNFMNIYHMVETVEKVKRVRKTKA